MKASERDILIHDIWKGIYGIPGTAEKGMMGDIKEIIEGQRVQNGSILRNTIWRRVICGVGGASLLGLTGWVIRLTFGE